MGKVYAELDERLIEFIRAQPLFFVATAPCLDKAGQSTAGQAGHVNISPKGYQDTFAVIDPLTVAYLDLTGSGAETIAHLRQNGRITIMFCSFDRTPKILRIYGTGRVVLPEDADWASLAPLFGRACDAAHPNHHDADHRDADHRDADHRDADHRDADHRGPDLRDGDHRGAVDPARGDERAIIVVSADRISDSCGYAVPVMELAHERDLLIRWAENRTPVGLVSYRSERNAVSIDGLPALG